MQGGMPVFVLRVNGQRHLEQDYDCSERCGYLFHLCKESRQ